MANPEHLAILKQGVEVWNRWRQASVSMYPDLGGKYYDLTELRSLHLNSIDFRRTDVGFSDFTDTELAGAGLSGAWIVGSRFANVTLKGARLIYTMASGADFKNADLREVDLTRANFNGANFRRANLTDAFFNETILTDANLTDCHGIGQMPACWS